MDATSARGTIRSGMSCNKQSDRNAAADAWARQRGGGGEQCEYAARGGYGGTRERKERTRGIQDKQHTAQASQRQPDAPTNDQQQEEKEASRSLVRALHARLAVSALLIFVHGGDGEHGHRAHMLHQRRGKAPRAHWQLLCAQ